VQNPIVCDAVGLYRHNPHFHAYWGLVRFGEYGEQTLYPYLGFDWYIGKKWRVSGILPWLTISYAPTWQPIFKFGPHTLAVNGRWVSRAGIITNDFGK
jgi:hypothetical protein